MRTLQEKYNAILEGNFSKTQFVRDAKLEVPNLLSPYSGFEDSVSILKNRSIIFEAKKEKVTAYEPTPAGLPAEAISRGIDYELEAIGINTGVEMPTQEQLDKVTAKVHKNLAKDLNYYLNLLSGESKEVNKHDQLELVDQKKLFKGGDAEGNVDTFNGMKKAELREAMDAALDPYEDRITIIKQVMQLLKKERAAGNEEIKGFIKTHMGDILNAADDETVLDEFDNYVSVNYDFMDEKKGKDLDGDGDIDGDDYMAARSKAINKAKGDVKLEESLNEAPYQTTYIKFPGHQYKKAMDILNTNIDPTYVKMDIVDNDGDGNVIVYFNFKHEAGFDDMYDDSENPDSEFYQEPEENPEAFLYDVVMDLRANDIEMTGMSHDVDDIFKNEVKVKTVNGEGEANAWMNQARRTMSEGRRKKMKGGKIVTENDYETGGYVESMGPELDRVITHLLSVWNEWKDGPMTEPGMIPHAKSDLVNYLGNQLQEDSREEDDREDDELSPEELANKYAGSPMFREAEGSKQYIVKERLKEGFKKLIKEILTEDKKVLKEAATGNLSRIADTYNDYEGMQAAVNALENIVTDVESYYAKTKEKIQKVYDSFKDIRNDEGLAVGALIGPGIEAAFRKDLMPVTEKGFTRGLEMPKVRMLKSGEVQEEELEEKKTIFTPVSEITAAQQKYVDKAASKPSKPVKTQFRKDIEAAKRAIDSGRLTIQQITKKYGEAAVNAVAAENEYNEGVNENKRTKYTRH
jgi:hypothetical protein